MNPVNFCEERDSVSTHQQQKNSPKKRQNSPKKGRNAPKKVQKIVPQKKVSTPFILATASTSQENGEASVANVNGDTLEIYYTDSETDDEDIILTKKKGKPSVVSCSSDSSVRSVLQSVG